MAKVLTIILNWRTPEMSLRAAETALRAMQGLDGALTIVDNGSGDGSFEKMSAAMAERARQSGAGQPGAGSVPVQVLQSGRNGGFGAGNNYGIRAGLPGREAGQYEGAAPDNGSGQNRAGGGGGRPDYVCILNSDAFPEADAIRRLYDYLEANPRCGFAGSALYGEDGSPHQTAFRFPSARSEFESHLRLGLVSRLLRRHVVALPLPQEVTEVDWLAGASLMMRMDMLDQIGLFDERFFLYFEETDLCLRGHRAGWKAVYLPQSRVMHLGSVSTGMKSWARMPGYWLDSRLHYFAKNHGRAGAVTATLAAVTAAGLWRLRLLLQRRDRLDPPFYLRDLITHHMRHGFRETPSDPARAKAETAS